MSLEEFEASEKEPILVVHEVLMLGQATTRLSRQFREAHPEVDWRRWMDIRNYVVHVYDKVDLEEIWEIMKNDLPRLIEEIEPLVQKEE